MAISEFKVTFKVSVEDINSGFTVFVVGDCPELGQWKPKFAKELQLTSRLKSRLDGSEVWSGSFVIKSTAVINYRFFIGIVDHSGAGMVTVDSWENMPTPRNLRLVEGVEQNVALTFGHSDGGVFIDRGWLTGQVAVHLSLHDFPLELYAPLKTDQKYFVKCLPVDTRVEKGAFTSVDSNSNDENAIRGPEARVLVSALDDDNAASRLMPPDGVLYEPNSFVTFRIESWHPQHLAFRFVVGTKDDLQELGSAFLGPVNLKRSNDRLSLSLISIDQTIIGQLKVDVLVIKSLDHEYDLPSRAENLIKERTWFIGHRGMGRTLIDGVHVSAVAENTISSLNKAIDHGADFVEFDVMLSRDRIPILHHDFVTSIGATNRSGDRDSKITVPVQLLSLNELDRLKTSASIVAAKEIVHLEDQPFPLLRSCLEKVDARGGFNVEVKYCMRLRSGELEEGLEHFSDRNEYIDAILYELLRHSGNRRIVLSSFDPDVCTMLRTKQNRYPVLFLTQGETEKYPQYEDPRTWSVEAAVQFAVAESLRGVCVHAESLLKNPSLIQNGQSRGLLVVCWGDDNNNRDNIRVLMDGKVDGIIVDKINEFIVS